MSYHSFWRTAGILVGIVAVLGLVLFSLLVYTQWRQVQGDPIISNTTNSNPDSLESNIAQLIPPTDQKTVANFNTNANQNTNSTYKPTVDDDPMIGSSVAPITIIAFEDFECPFSAAATPIVRTLLTRYPNDVRFILRDFPLYTIHSQAVTAALAAECADDQNMYWKWHDLVYERQDQLGSAPAIYSDWAKELGLDAERFEACLTQKKHSAEIQRDQNAGVLGGVTATPTFFVNGYKVEGVITLEQWTQLIELLLAEQ